MVLLEQFGSDLRRGLRQLVRYPMLSAAAVACFALGIGANTAVFSVVNAVLFRAPPFMDPDRLVVISQGFSGMTADRQDFGRVNSADYLDFQEGARRVISASGLAERRDVNIAGEGDPLPAVGMALTPSIFPLLGVNPVLGRPFTEADVAPGAPSVTILSDGLWRTRFAEDADIVGKIVTFANGRTSEIVGVMGPEFSFPAVNLGAGVGEIFFTLPITPASIAQRGSNYASLMFGRLAPGASVEGARTSLGEIARQLPLRYPETYGLFAEAQGAGAGEFLVHVRPLQDAAVGDARTPLLLLLAAVGFVTLIACINVSGLLLARAAARHREISVRRALGSSTRRLGSLFFAEAIVLVVVGGTLGVWAASWAAPALASVTPGEFYRSFQIEVDGRVLAFTLSAMLAAALAFALVPGLHASRLPLLSQMRSDGRSLTAAPGRQRALRHLVIAELALATSLAIGAGLVVRSYSEAIGSDPGFDRERLLTFRMTFPATRYPTGASVEAVQRQFMDRLAEVPSVVAAGSTSNLPMTGNPWITGFVSEDVQPDAVPTATNASVLPGFFEAMGVPVLYGRDFASDDGPGSEPVVIVGKATADRYFGGSAAVGRRLAWGRTSATGEFGITPWSRIVGVVADVKYARVDQEPDNTLYIPSRQAGVLLGNPQFADRNVNIVLRTTGAPEEALPAVREAVAEVDPQLLVRQATGMDRLVTATVGDRQFNALLFGLFSVLALLLAAVGVYGVMYFSVAQRTRELGIRIAVGAPSAEIVRMILREAAGMAAIGIGIGVLIAVGLTQTLRGILFGVGTLDVLTFVGGASVLLIATVTAGYLPARRAVRLDPMVALRNE